MQFISRGFTLIELMLALAISAILVAIGYPTYITHQTHAERNRAEIALMQLAAKMEIYLCDHHSYSNATIEKLHATHLVDGLHYRLQIAAATDSHYLVQAMPTSTQKKRDISCEILSLTDTNVRNVSGTGDVKQCWI